MKELGRFMVRFLATFVVIFTAITIGRNIPVDDANAGVRTDVPVLLTALSMSSADSLFVQAAFTPGTVSNPVEPVLNDLNWFRNSVMVDSMRATAQTVDTLRIGRSPLGGTDTIRVDVSSSYQGRFGPTATAIAVFDNPDLQVPGMPIIISVDTTCNGLQTCP